MSAGQLVAALAATCGVLAYLLLHPGSKAESSAETPERPTEPVRVVGPGLIRIEPNTPLTDKLKFGEVRLDNNITAPVLTVTGTVAASLRPGKGQAAFAAVIGTAAPVGRSGDYWQFNSPEVLTTFTDWQKAKADITFSRAQLVRVREASLARTAAQRDLVATMAKLEAAGTETKKQLAIEQATLRQYEIQQQSDIYQAQTAIRVAERNEAAAARQLQQAGLDPALLSSVTSDLDVVMADVPEGFLGRVKVGQGCKAEFFGIPDRRFDGRVQTIAPVLSKDRRSLRVLFTVDDPEDLLRPGMFAEIGLGTDPREALLAPPEGVIHVGRTDYLLVATRDSAVWRVTPVEVGEVVSTATPDGRQESRVEVLKGLARPESREDQDRVIAQGAILLKPVIVTAVRRPGPGTGVGP